VIHTTQKKARWAALAIIICTLLWGLGFPALKSIEELPTFHIISVRFIIASIILSLIFMKRFKLVNRVLVRNAFILSFLVFVMYVFATVGIKYTTSAKASFFSCLGFVIIPFLNLLFYKQKITKVIVISVCLCLIGIFFLSYSPDLGFNLALGDIICVGSSVSGSLQIVFLDRTTKKAEIDPTMLSIWMMIFVAVLSTIVALFTNSFTASAEGDSLYLLIFIGIFCTAIPYVLQAIGQTYIPSTRVGLICALEPTSGAIFSVILLGDKMGLHGWVGGAIVIISLLYMEIMNSKSESPTDPSNRNIQSP
jgi:drug/metabolite transporter (DMT)-like permease